MGIWEKVKKLISGEGISFKRSNHDTKTYTVIHEDGKTTYEVEGVKYNSLDEIPDPELRQKLSKL